MAKIILTQSELFDFVPLLLLTALKNDDLIDPDSPALDLYNDIEKKVLTKLRQYYLAIDPELRRKLKFLLMGVTAGENAVITIKGEPEPVREKKYLTEKYQPMGEIIRKYV